MITLKSISGEVIIEGDFDSVYEAIKAAIAARASLCGVDLPGVDLPGVDLPGVNLADAYLASANLAGAYLAGADLHDANLAGADLAGANLCDANLQGANLQDAYLPGANLCDANLAGADLHDADIVGVNLYDANLAGALNAELAQFCILPQEGSFIAWKKLLNGVVAKLEIPTEARRVNAFGSRKCRAEFVKVLSVFGEKGVTEGRGAYDSTLIYRVGEIVRPDSFDDFTNRECCHGIHFFLTREEAEEYQ